MSGPFLDVSNLTVDPDFADRFDVERRPETVNSFGESTVVGPTIYPRKLGVVTFANPNDLERIPEADRSGRTISVITKFRIQAPSPGVKGDILTWRGDRYQVQVIEPYVQLGAGFIQALCSSIDTQQAAPKDMA